MYTIFWATRRERQIYWLSTTELKASYLDGKKWIGYYVNRAHISDDIKTTSSAMEVREALEKLISIGSVTVTKTTIVEDGSSDMCIRYIRKDCPAFDQSQTRMFTMYQCPTCQYDPVNDPNCVCALYNFPYQGCGNWGKGMSSETIIWGDGCHGHKWTVEFLSNFGDIKEIQVSADKYSGFTYGNKAIACDDNRNIECTLTGGKTYGSPPNYIGPGTVLSVFTRVNGTADHAKAIDLRSRRFSIPVTNTDAAFRPRIASTVQYQSALGRWNDAGGQCLDTVIKVATTMGHVLHQIDVNVPRATPATIAVFSFVKMNVKILETVQLQTYAHEKGWSGSP